MTYQHQIPTHQLVQPLLTFTPNNVPPFPDVRFPEWMGDQRPIATTAILNIISREAAAGSPLRIWHWNRICMYSFKNEHLRDLTQFCVDLSAFNLKKGQFRNRDDIVIEAAAQVVELDLGFSIMTFKELSAVASAQAMNAASRDQQLLVQIQHELKNAANSGFFNSPPGNDRGGYGVPANDNRYGQAQTDPWGRPADNGRNDLLPYQQRQQDTGYGSGGYGGSSRGSDLPWADSPAPASSRPSWGSSNSSSGNALSEHRKAHDNFLFDHFENKAAAMFSKKEPEVDRGVVFPTPFNTVPEETSVWSHEELHGTPVVARTETPLIVVDEITYLEIEGGSEMDRGAHSIVYDGQQYELNTPAFDQYRREAINLEMSTMTRAPEPTGDDQSIKVGDTIVYDCFEQNLIADFRCRFLADIEKDDVPLKIKRYFGRVGNPIAVRKSTVAVWREMLIPTSFTNMVRAISSRTAVCLSSHGGTIETQRNNTSVLLLMSSFDSILTKRANVFLRESLGNAGIISSFVLDFEEVGAGLESAYSLKYRHLWEQFINELYLRVTCVFDENLKETIDGNFTAPEGLEFVCVPSTMSVTCVDMTMRELGYKVDNTARVIDRVDCPALYAIAASLRKHKKQMTCDTDADYLATNDGQLFRIFRDFRTGADNVYTLRFVENKVE